MLIISAAADPAVRPGDFPETPTAPAPARLASAASGSNGGTIMDVVGYRSGVGKRSRAGRSGGGGQAADGPDVAVALRALESDARRWAEAAVTLRGAAGVVAARGLAPAVFSFAGGEVAAVYEQLRDRTASLLAEGARNFDAVAAALRASAAAYAEDDAAGAHRLAAAGSR